MKRLGAKALAAIVSPPLGAVLVCAGVWQWSASSHHDSIRQLATLPSHSRVHLLATVIGADPGSHRLWIQDSTGALPVVQPSTTPRYRLGERIAVDAFTTSLPSPPSAAVPASASALDSPSDRLSISDAAPAVTLRVTRTEPAWRRWIPLALTCVTVLLLWLFALYEVIRRHRAALRKAARTALAVREFSTALQRFTRDGAFNTQFVIPPVEDLAPLAAGFNAMVAELERRDGIRRDAELHLRRMTLMDDVTALPNRHLLSDRLAQCLTRARRNQEIVALLCIDLDGFKYVNDSFGHSFGDALLGQVAQRLKTRFRHADTLARIGSDEFALILDDLPAREEAQEAAHTVIEALSEPFQISGHPIRIGACVGIGLYPDAPESSLLLQQADCAMYAAKRNGPCRIVQFGDNLGIAARERLTLERELQHAIARDEISVFYQPEIDLATNTIVRFEALARWTHPELGLILPAVFIPIAEDSGLITAIGSFIMERACAEAVTWQEIAGRPIQVAVNVSSVQFARETFFEEVSDVLQRTGLDPALLQVEVTESAALKGMDKAADMIRRLQRLGVSVAVDDFGTGYSCLTYLPRLPFDALKLDRSFVSEMMVRDETREFVGSILTLARSLDMKVIVEGIETDEQLRVFRSLGTDQAQGYLVGMPLADPSHHLRNSVLAATLPA